MALKIREPKPISMEVETREVENGTWIKVMADQEVAVVVDSEEGERIYLPDLSGEDSTYYAENTSGLVETEDGYTVLHEGVVEDITVLS